MDLERVGLPLLVCSCVAALTKRWWLPQARAWWRGCRLRSAAGKQRLSGLDRDLDV